MFSASTRRTASVCSSEYILYRVWTAASHLDSRPAHTCNCPTDVMMSSHRVDTFTFLTILLRSSPTSLSCNPGFLPNGIRRRDRKAWRAFARSFSIHSFFIMLLIVAHKLVELSLNCLHVRILSHPSAFVPECPEPPLVLVRLCEPHLHWYFYIWFDEYF